MRLTLPRTRAGRIVLALIILNEIRGLIVVGLLLWMAKESPL